jgi:hypothetical protein
VVKSQAIDIAEFILSLIRRPHIFQTLCSNSKSRCALLSTSEAHWSTTKSDGMWKKQMVVEAGEEGLTAAEQFYSLAA